MRGEIRKAIALFGKAWIDVVYQKLKTIRGCRQDALIGKATSFSGWGLDGGVKIDVAGFEGVLYGYTGKGVGTTGLFILPTSALAIPESPTAAMCKAPINWQAETRLELRSVRTEARR